MKKLSLLLLTLLLPLVAKAHDIAVANTDGVTIYYKWSNNNKTELSVSYSGSYANNVSNEYTGTVIIPPSVTYNGNTYPVTSVGSSAFYDCSGLTSVSIPNSVTSVGSSAFYGCSGLTSVNIPSSLTSIDYASFSGCSGLTNVTIGNGVTTISDAAFENCSSLPSLFIPASLSSISSSAFRGCTNLSEILVDVNNASFCSLDGVLMNKDMSSVVAFPDAKVSFVLPASVTSLNPSLLGSKIKSFQIADSDTPLTLTDGKFPNIENVYIGRNITLQSNSYSRPFSDVEIKSVIFGSKVTNIVPKLFYYSRLQAVTIPSSVTTINENAFSYCSYLNKVNYQGTLNQWLNISFSNNPLHNNADLYLNDLPISELTFANINGTVGTQLRGCTNLKSLIIASGNTSIDEYAFANCASLEKVTIPKSVITINGNAFNNCNNLDVVYYNGTLGDWFAMTLTANPLLYGADMYLNNTLLTNATIPSSITQIGTQLRGCTSLETVTIPVGVTDILNDAFRDCKSLSSVSVPSGVTSIGNYAFGDCISLTSVTIPSSVTSLSSTAFSGCTSLQSINFSGSANYTTIDGVVYDKDVTRIITYPQAKSSTTYTYPSTITTLGGIRDNSFLKRIYVPKLSSTPSINTYTFNVGENLVAVEFEDEIGDYYTKDGVVYKKYEYNGESQNYLIYCPRGKKSLTLSSDVKYVYVDGFRPTSLLESITIEPSEQSISFYSNSDYSTDMAFHSPLKSLNIGRQINIGNSLYNSKIFAQNPELETVVIGENMTYIPSDLFVNCSRLTHVTLPETITSVGSNAFAGTPWLASLPTLNGVKYYNYIALEYKYSEETKNVRLKDGISVVASGLFKDTDVESVELPTSVTSLESSLFYGCKSLKDVVLPNSIKTIPNNLDIGYGNSGSINGVVENIHVPSSVTWIGIYAINQCDTVVIEDDNTNRSLQLQDCNADDGYWDAAFSHVKKLYVGRNTALNGFSRSEMVFSALNSSSTQLTDVIFGPLVTKAFTGRAFGYCNHVKSVTSLGKIPFASPDFSEIPQTAVLYVPLGSKQQYASADGWSQFGDIREVTEVTITMDDTEMVYAGDFDLDFSKVDGLKAYVAGDFDKATSTLTLERAQLVSAGKGVILKGAKGTYTVPCANIEPTAADALCGTISGRFIRNTEGENVNYAFDKAEHVFKPVDAAYGCLISRNGAYLSLPASSVSDNGSITLQYKEMEEPGDLNGDGSINGVDLVAQTNLILTDQYNATADLNNDGVVNGLDYVIMVNMILSETSAPAMQAAGSNRAAATASLSIEDFDIKAGETKEMFINLSNPNTDLTLLQFDLRLPEGLSIAVEDGDYAIDIAGRTTWKKHSLMAKATNGITRFLLASNTNALIDGNDGNVISIKLTASDSFTSGDICLENQLLVSPNAEDMMLADYVYSVGNTTSINAIMAGQPVDVYTLTGSKVVSGVTSIKDLPKGIYIIKGKKAIVK